MKHEDSSPHRKHKDSPQWIEPGFITRVYYLFVVPFLILASLNMLVLLFCGVNTHYELLYQFSVFAVSTRRWAYGVLLKVLEILPVSILFGYALVGNLPISVRFWKFRNSPAGRYLRHRRRKKKKKRNIRPKL